MRKTRSVEIGEITLEKWEGTREHMVTIYDAIVGDVVIMKRWANRVRCDAVYEFLITLDEVAILEIVEFVLRKADGA
jgi:hypothetical protein